MNPNDSEHINESEIERKAEGGHEFELETSIVQRMHDKSNEELMGVIEDSIDGEERVLPGLGVLFEIIWKNSETEVQTQLISTLKEHLA